MRIDEQSLRQIAVDVFQMMLGLELNPLNRPVAAASQLLASVEIRGITTTIVEVFAPDELMSSIAEIMFRFNRGTLSEEEIRDAFGEIANMIGGNLKGGFAEDAELSLPVIGEAHDWLDRIPHGSLRTTFECCNYPLTIVVREAVSEPKTIGSVR